MIDAITTRHVTSLHAAMHSHQCYFTKNFNYDFMLSFLVSYNLVKILLKFLYYDILTKN